jgi:hypothetical protein
MKNWLICCAAWLLVQPLANAGIPIQFWTLDNGARVYLMEVQGLPMVDIQLEFDAGSRRDSKKACLLWMKTSWGKRGQIWARQRVRLHPTTA